MTKAPIVPMRPEDKLHTFDPNMSSNRHHRGGNGGGRPQNNRSPYRRGTSTQSGWNRNR